MSRYSKVATNPITKQKHEAAYGWDEIPGFKPGYFFQVFDIDDPDKIIVNEGFLNGISEERLKMLKKKWSIE